MMLIVYESDMYVSVLVLITSGSRASGEKMPGKAFSEVQMMVEAMLRRDNDRRFS